MSPYFLDTSALVKRYIPEKGSDQVDALLEQGETCVISNLTLVELFSTFARLSRVDSRFTAEDVARLRDAVWDDIAGHRIETLDVSREDCLKAIDLLANQYLTPVDSVLLSTALTLNEQSGGKVILASSDEKVNALAGQLGLAVLDPTASRR